MKIKLHTQQSPTWRLIVATPPLLHLLENDSTLDLDVSHLHHHTWRPIETGQNLSFSLVTTFVNISTVLASVYLFQLQLSIFQHWPYEMVLELYVFSPRMKCWVICKMNALWLSLYNVPISCFLPNSFINLCNQIISLLASIAATYSSSVVESATTLWIF